MSNLGAYQWITTISKKVGGPRILLGLVAGGGAFAGITMWETIKKIYNKAKGYLPKDEIIESKIYEVINDFNYEKLKLSKGMKFKIITYDEDCIWIEIIDDSNNPYLVHKKYLDKYTTYK